MTEKKDKLRSARWFAPDDLRAFGHRSRAMQMGYALEDWQGKPVIAIINSWSDINQCHSHFKSRVEDVKRGILQAGGFPIELPTLSLSEPFIPDKYFFGNPEPLSFGTLRVCLIILISLLYSYEFFCLSFS